MGGWIMLLVALARPDRVKGLIGIAPAPDFTEDLIRPALSALQLAALERDGVFLAPSA
jgi:pimeloyl-ACP methyl ester carboxylesterase